MAPEKYVLQLALNKFLPKEIVWRRKFGMSVPITSGRSVRRGPLEDLLGPAALARRGLFRPEYVSELRRGKTCRRNPAPAAGRTLWTLRC